MYLAVHFKNAARDAYDFVEENHKLKYRRNL